MHHVDVLRVEVNDGGVELFVNGRDLCEHAAVVELPFARAGGSPMIAGDYAGLPQHLVGPEHYLGSPVLTWFEDCDTVLLGCGCGEWGCWPLTARVEVGTDRVVWSHFRQGHRDWDLGDLGPFRFERAQYEAALSVLGSPRES